MHSSAVTRVEHGVVAHLIDIIDKGTNLRKECLEVVTATKALKVFFRGRPVQPNDEGSRLLLTTRQFVMQAVR